MVHLQYIFAMQIVTHKIQLLQINTLLKICLLERIVTWCQQDILFLCSGASPLQISFSSHLECSCCHSFSVLPKWNNRRAFPSSAMKLLLSTGGSWLPVWCGLDSLETGPVKDSSLKHRSSAQCLIVWVFNLFVKDLYKWLFSWFTPPHPHLLPQQSLSFPILCSSLFAFWYIHVLLLWKEYGPWSWKPDFDTYVSNLCNLSKPWFSHL